MRAKKNDDFTRLHSIVLGIYKAFKQLCDENSIRYFAISGTTIGAVHWGGFIPWDDDMDIAMPVEDYEKFKKLVKKLPNHLAFSEYLWFGGKLSDRRTTFTNIFYAIDPKRYNGVFIDIVPLIGLPNNSREREAFINDLKAFQAAGLLFDRYDELDGITKEELYDWQEKILHSYPFGKTKYVMDFSDPRYVLETKGFLKPIEYKFEDSVIPVSSNAKADLSIQYKNFMKYPPKESRGSLHQMLGILDLDLPYAEAEKRYAELPGWAKDLFKAKHTNEMFYLKSLNYRAAVIDSLTKENERLRKRAEEIDVVYNSASYKLGHALLKPISFIKRKVSKKED